MDGTLNDSVIQDYLDIKSNLTAVGSPFETIEVVANARTVRVYTKAASNLPPIFAEIENRFADRDLVLEGDSRLTYGEVFSRAKWLAGALRDKYGVRPGDTVGLSMANRAEWIIAFAAIIWVGGIAVLFNSRSSSDELANALSTVPCSTLIADGKRAALFGGLDDNIRIIAVDDGDPIDLDARTTWIEELFRFPAADPEVTGPDSVAAVLFSSGTTGRPKGIALTHRNFANMVMNFQFIGTCGLMLAAQRMGVTPGVLSNRMPTTSALLVFPLFHISGISSVLSTALSGGVLTVLRRWRGDKALELIKSNGVTSLSGPPLVVADLLKQPDAAERLSTINNVAVGGQATPLNLISQISRAMPTASQSVGWGMTEVCGAASAAAGSLFAARPGSAGILSPLVDLRVVDDTGHDLPPGATGEFWLRSGLVMDGYWNAPEATTAAFEGEWYKTGDIGFVDADGFVFLVDRKKDMVICAGENIYCAEVERVLSADEAFEEVALFGVPDDRLGERAIAAVTLRKGYQRTEEQVKALAQAALADCKVPSAVAFDLGPFPRNSTGKVIKARLRATYLEHQGTA